MKDDGVEFVKGDAFTFAPTTWHEHSENADDSSSWMVSDVIAYPERVIELLHRWCGGHWATFMIITMKFQGGKPSWDDLDHAIEVANSHGYHCRAKHFFNNKNEVTLMLFETRKKDGTRQNIVPLQLQDGVIGSAMYKALLP